MKRPLFVSFSGTHCVGKSTLLKEVANKLKRKGYSVIEVEEYARKVPREFHGTLKGQQLMFEILKKELIKASMEDADIVLIDRSPVDIIYYILFFACAKQWTVEEIKSSVKFLEDTSELISKFDLLFYIDGVDAINIADDGFRFTDEHSRHAVDLIAKSFYVLARNLGFIKIKQKANAVAETANEIIDLIESKIRNKSKK